MNKKETAIDERTVVKALLLGTFWKIGIKNRKWINLTYVKFTSDTKRAKWLSEIEGSFSTIG